MMFFGAFCEQEFDTYLTFRISAVLLGVLQRLVDSRKYLLLACHIDLLMNNNKF